jgi:Family of unknown function (DUF6134)
MKFRAALFVVLYGASFLRAGGEERRTFSVQIDKKPSGSHEIVIQTRDDGSEVVTCQADIAVKALLVTYKYTYHGVETWKDNRLLRLATTTNDDGKKHAVSAEATKDGLAIKADGKESLVKGLFWLTSYWKLPSEKQRGPGILLIDADTGNLINARMEKVGVEKMTVLGQMVELNHCRLTGGVKADLWYDGADRLTRQESIEDGHLTVLELSRLLRD